MPAVALEKVFWTPALIGDEVCGGTDVALSIINRPTQGVGGPFDDFLSLKRVVAHSSQCTFVTKTNMCKFFTIKE